jgi:hypothetical protein
MHSVRSVRRVGILCLTALSAGCGAAQERAIPAADAAKFYPQILALVAQQDPFPHDAKPRLELTGGGAREVRLDGQPRIVLPLLIRFDGVDNSYCRLAVVDAENKQAQLIEIPGSQDHCQGMQRLAAVDVNHDGVPDFVFQVSMPSNTADATVSEGAVYLSQPATRSYCFAPAAGGALPSDVPFDAGKVMAAIDAAVARKGPQILNCSSARKTPGGAKD